MASIPSARMEPFKFKAAIVLKSTIASDEHMALEESEKRSSGCLALLHLRSFFFLNVSSCCVQWSVDPKIQKS